MYLPLGASRSAFARVLTVPAFLVALVACSDRIVEPAAQSVEAALTPVQSVVVSDIVERVTPSLGDEAQTTLLARRFNELREHMEAGRLSDAAASIARTRGALREAQNADDGTLARKALWVRKDRRDRPARREPPVPLDRRGRWVPQGSAPTRC